MMSLVLVAKVNELKKDEKKKKKKKVSMSTWEYLENGPFDGDDHEKNTHSGKIPQECGD